MEERERMLDTIMEMQKWNGIKDEQIEALEKENQALKERWQKLKSHIEKERNTNSNISLSCSDCMYSNAEMFCEELLEKMQELEKE